MNMLFNFQDPSIMLEFLAPRIVFSIICGIIIGIDRELKGKSAGLRTSILICLGASIFSSLSHLSAEQNGGGDPMRVIAQIVSGIGFLGAGAIFRSKGFVVGITSGAIIWLTGAIGAMIGVGLFGPALIISTSCVFVLVVFEALEKYFLEPHAERYISYDLSFSLKDADYESFVSDWDGILVQSEVTPSYQEIKKEENYYSFKISYGGKGKQTSLFKTLIRDSRLFDLKQEIAKTD